MRFAFRTLLMTTLLGVSLACFAQHGPRMDAPLGMLAQSKAQLNLNTSQQQQWDAVVAQTKAAHETMRTNAAQLKATMDAELAKNAPDLAAVAAASDAMHQQNEALHKQTRDAWLALYATFTPDQKLVVRDTLRSGMDTMATRRKMHAPPPTG